MAAIINLQEYFTESTIKKITDLLFDACYVQNETYATLVTNLVKLIEIDIKSGDILQLEPTKNVNGENLNPIYNRLIWTGMEAISIDYDTDDTGSIPLLPIFSVPQYFKIDHWSQVINRGYIPLNCSINFKDQILENHKPCHQIKHHSHDEVETKEGVSLYQFSQSSFVFHEITYSLYYIWILTRPISFEEIHEIFKDELSRNPILPYQHMTTALEENYIVDEDIENDPHGLVHIFTR